MPRTLAEHKYKAPMKKSGTPYKWANGEELWTFLGSHAQRAMNRVAGMRSLNAGNVAGDAYLFGEAVAGPPPGVEFMPYDMFTPQPVKKVHVYYYRHIFHD
jgi:hypothetical protein